MAMSEPEYEPASLEEQKEAAASNLSTLRAAVAAHISGAPWDWIAERYQYSSPQTARVAVEKFIGETHTASDLTSARNKARARYERLLQGTWYDATHPFLVDDKGKQLAERNEAHLPSLDRARGLVGDLARLDGLNAPTQLQVYVPGADEIMEVVGALRQAKLEGTAKEANIFDAEVIEEDEDVEEG